MSSAKRRIARENFAERLAVLRSSLHGKRGKSAFAKALDMPRGTYSEYENGFQPTADFIAAVVRTTGCSAQWLLTGAGQPFAEGSAAIASGTRKATSGVASRLSAQVAEIEERYQRLERELAEQRGEDWPCRPVEIVVPEQIAERMAELGDDARQFAAVPLLADAAAAGNPRDIDESVLDSYCIIYRPWLRNPESTTCIRVVGESMEPVLHHGSIVAVNHADREPRGLVGKIVALRHPEEEGVLVRRLLHPRGYWQFQPDNPGADDRGEPFPVVILPESPDAPDNPIIGKIDWAWSLFP